MGVIGLYVGVAALAIGDTLRTGWLFWRSAPLRRCLGELEEAGKDGLFT